MGKDKLRKFAAIKTFDNVLEPVRGESFPIKGNWRKDFFKNDNPIVVELGCGKGEYSVGMGKMFPDVNYIGVDIKGNRIFIGAKQAIEEKIYNVGFLRTRIDFIEAYFGPEEVDEIWLTFSDPQPNKPRKRLSSPLFIHRYRNFLKKGGRVHVKTDSDLLFDYTLEQIESEGYEPLDIRTDLYATLATESDAEKSQIFSIQTYYEKLFSSKGHIIKYTCFKIH
ncbi:MAG: tRNA (guanosine(46)-N7)-methyltransferase TrmB [Flavobacteriia bacterium]